MHTSRVLEALITGLRGCAVASSDWQAVLALANHTLLTPALSSALAHTGQMDRLPRDVRDYLEFIHNRNRQRNLRLRAQLKEAVEALNRRQIVPLLLKGAVPLFVSPADRIPSRMTSDLDLAVEAAEEVTARDCLAGLGYCEVAGVRGMARPQDAGILELRRRRSNDLEPPRFVRRGRLQVKIPVVQSRALHWIMHDLVKEGDYWRGRIDLRHLHDLAQLAERDGVDWSALRASLPDRGSRNALDTQLLALHHFFAMPIPHECGHRPLVRFQHWRRVFTARHPVIGAPLRLAGNLAWGAWRISRRGALTRGGPIDLAHRITRTLIGIGTKI